MEGGLKQKDPTKVGIIPLLDMIHSPSAYIETLTNDSLYGFIIELSVSKEDSEYFNLEITQFTKPVTRFIIKMVVLTAANDRPLKDFNGRSKNSMSRQKLFEEAKTQQYIWRETILSGREEICPSIATFSLLDNNQSKEFVQFITNKNRLSSFDYMDKLFTSNDQYGLGLILMPKIDSYTFSHVSSSITREENQISQELLDKTYSQIVSKVVQLFIEEGIVHFDLHTRNILVSYLKNSVSGGGGGSLTPKVTIIDFGRIAFCQSMDEDYLTSGEKKRYKLKEMKKKFYDFYREHFDVAPSANDTKDFNSTLFPSVDVSPEKDPHKQIQFINEVMEYLVMLGIEIGHINHANSKRYKEDPNMYQMIWYDDVRRSENKDRILYQAFQYLKRHMYQPPEKKKQLNKIIMEKLEREGLIIDFGSNYKKFIEEDNTFPLLLTTIRQRKKWDIQHKYHYKSATPPPRPLEPTSSTPLISRTKDEFLPIVFGTVITAQQPPVSSTPMVYYTVPSPLSVKGEKKVPKKRCPRGFRKNKVTQKCVEKGVKGTGKGTEKKGRCKNGTRRHPPKTGKCLPYPRP